MKTRSELDHCSAAQLAALLGLAVAPGAGPSSLPAESRDAARLARLLTDFLPEDGESGQTLLEMVCETSTAVETLRRLKELGKRLAADSPSEAHRDAARVLYHAAVAAAYAYHGENASSRPIESRLALYEDLAAALGGQPLGSVFREAVERCQRA